MDTERFEELLGLSIGELRDALAYEDSEKTFEAFLVENGWIDDESDEEYDWSELDEEEEDDPDLEDDEVCEDDGSDELDDESESLANDIAYDIDHCKYSLETIEGLYSDEIVERVKYLID